MMRRQGRESRAERPMPRSIVVPLLLSAALMLWLAPVFNTALAQIEGAVTEFNITNPDPETSQTTPFRTSNQFVKIEFSHNGATGSYFISTVGADLEGSTFMGDNNGNFPSQVLAGFTEDKVATVNLILFQTRVNLTFRTTQGVRIQYDSTPPNWDIRSVQVGNPGGGDPISLSYSPATVYYTADPNITITGSISDPDNGSEPQECKFDVEGIDPPLTDQQWGQEDGTYEGQIQLPDADGEYTLQIYASDSFEGDNDDPTAKPNRSLPKTLKVVLDRTAPTIEDIKIIRHFDDATQKQELPTGHDTFVGAENIVIKVTFSEKMQEPPRLAVQQQDGNPIYASLLSDQTVDQRVFFYQYSVNNVNAQNGPASLIFEAQYDGPTGQPDYGYDLARNALAEAPVTIENAFTVDTIGPDLMHFENPQPGDVVSIPADGERISGREFPRTLQVFVEDYDKSGTTQDASGVDFSNIVSQASSGSTSGSDGTALSIKLIAPDGTEVYGTPSIAPPNTVLLTLPDWTDPDVSLPGGFVQDPQTGERLPMEGTWRIEVALVDKVGNTSQVHVTFIVDNTPIPWDSVLVSLEPEPSIGNPIPQTGTCLGIQDVQSGWPTVTVSSTDPSFSVTRTIVEFYSKLKGEDGSMTKYDATIERNENGVVMSEIRRPGMQADDDDWPLPNDPVPADYVPEGTLDPRVGRYDGMYVIRVIPEDDAGNRGVRRNGTDYPYKDYEVKLDTMDPYVAWTFPAWNSAINEPLRFVDAVVVDPAAPNGNEGCGIDVNRTAMTLWVLSPYRQDDFDTSYMEGGAASFPGKLRGTLRFIHNPNNDDPTLPGFNPEDDTYRVLLELVDSNQYVRPLKDDGTMDGIYCIAVNPVDKAGNDLAIDTQNTPDPTSHGEYYGLKPSASTTWDRGCFAFLYDTIEPTLTVTEFPDGSYIGGASFVIKGETRDLSARPDDPTRGGSGILKVVYKLEVVDENGNPIPSEEAHEDDDNPGVIIPAKNNPVIDWTEAELSPIRDKANDPTRTVTNPMTAEFADTLREKRTWTINGTLPPEDELLLPRQSRPDNPDSSARDYYRLTIRVYDRAGNYTEIVRRVTLSLDSLRPPTLLEPECGSYVNRLVTTFKWQAVPGAVAYRFRLVFPDGNVLERRVEGNTETTVTLSREGEYRWQVASIDSADNQGEYSQYCSFTLDRTAPTINQFIITNPVQTPNQSGKISLGEFIVDITFSEPLDQTRPVYVTFDPVGAVGAEPQVVTTQVFQVSDSNTYWKGRGVIPSDAVPADWDGMVTFKVQGAVDLAGNEMQAYYNSDYEIDTGPYFEAHYFASLFNPYEFTLLLVASEDINGIPTLSDLQGLDYTGSSNTLSRVANSLRAFTITMKLTNTASGDVSMAVSAEDLDHNVCKRTLSFKVVRPSNGGVNLSLRAGGSMALTLSPEDRGKDAPIYVFPSFGSSGENSSIYASAAAALGMEEAASGRALSSTTVPGLIDLTEVENIQAPLLDLEQAAEVRFELPSSVAARLEDERDRRRAGVYCWKNGEWRYLGGRWTDENTIEAELAEILPVKVALDVTPPLLSRVTDGEGPEKTISSRVRVKVIEEGSGVDPDAVSVKAGGRSIPFTLEGDEISFEIPRWAQESGSEILVSAADRAGNQALTMSWQALKAPAFGFAGRPLAYPNPARYDAWIRFDLTYPTSTEKVTLDIYDASGRRIRRITSDGPFGATGNRLRWDTRASNGRHAANGVYFFRLRAYSSSGERGTARGKIAVLR